MSPIVIKDYHTKAIAGIAATTLFAVSPSLAATSTDLGAKSGSDIKSVSLVLKLRNPAKLATFVQNVTNPRSSVYHQFLSVADFTAAYAPSANDVATVVTQLKAAGINVSDVSPNRLVIHANGSVDALNKYFSTSIHEYASGSDRYHAPALPVTIPAAVTNSVITVVGMSSQGIYHPKFSKQAAGEAQTLSSVPARQAGGTATGVPGQFTVGDVANLYQVNPLYSNGIKGTGRTIGIATLATFDPSDAYGYWSAIGLKVKANRIKQVHVDGGGDPVYGSDETTLDVEQSGGMAPQADIVVYDAPNTDQGFFDVFLQAVLDNQADSLSVSWGSPEIATTPELAAGQDELFLEAAAQGMSLFAASGDAGAFDINYSGGPYTLPQCSNTLTTDSPASSPYITAAGGLTIAGKQQHRFPTPVVNVLQDRPWGWNYLANYFNANYPQVGGYYGIAFPVGGGGGVSVNEPLPKYQQNLAGIRTSQPSQSLICQTPTGAADLIDLPENQAGRNVPDLSLNADPYTGYLVYFGGTWYAGYGGTSFVAPQLNGIAALLAQSAGSRLGLLNPIVYRLARQGSYGKNGAFNDITTADNLGFQAGQGYDPASGIGSLNTANLAQAIGNDQGEIEGN
jgi:subtilase family serine protease